MAPHADDSQVNGSRVSPLGDLPVFSITKLTDERTKTLRECLRGNHEMFAVLRDPYLIFHNHMPHVSSFYSVFLNAVSRQIADEVCQQILGSAYYLGASNEQLRAIAKHEGEELRPQNTVPVQEALSKSKWRQYLGSKDHTLAFQKLFDDEIENAGGDWKRVVDEYLYASDSPLVNGLCGGCTFDSRIELHLGHVLT